jgi:homocysteine S-methyltransferase
MNPLAPIIAARGRVILDGAMATELERRGYDLDDPLWSARLLLEAPDAIREVHSDYFAAGADVAITATYQATFEGFAARGIAHGEAVDVMRLAVRLAIEARDAFWADPARREGRSRPLVAASIGPYGAFLADGSEYRGNYGLSVDELMTFHRPRMAVLAASGADLLACETIPCRAEGEALAALLREFRGTPAWISFSCRDGVHVNEGQRLDDCISAIDGNEAIVAVGINCTDPRHIDSLLTVARRAIDKPIVVYPNSGERYDAAHHTWSGPRDPLAFALHAARWHAEGAAGIGGCCRTGPEEIRLVRDAVDTRVLT